MLVRLSRWTLVPITAIACACAPATLAHAGAPARGLDDAARALASGHAAEAEARATVALQRLERSGHPDSLSLAWGWSLVTRARLEQGRAPDSLQSARAAIAAGILERRLPPADPRVADALETAALVRARPAAAATDPVAVSWLRRAVASRRARALEPDTALATTLHRLAAAEGLRAGADSARVHLEQALAIRERGDSASLGEAARLHRDLAELLMNRKDDAAARRHLDAAVSLAERRWGPRTTELVPILQLRSRYFGEVDQAPLALPELQRAYEIDRAAYGDDDDRTLLLHASVASRYLLLGDPRRGREELSDVERRLAAKPHPDTLKLAGVRYGLAGTCFQVGDSAEGVRWLERSARDHEAVGHIHDIMYIYSQEILTRTAAAYREPARAESVLARAIALDRDRPGSPDAATGTLVGRYCQLLFDRRDYHGCDARADSLVKRFERLGLTRTVPITHGYHWKYFAQMGLGHPAEAFQWARRLSEAERTITVRNVRGMSERGAFDFERQRAEPIEWLLDGAESLGGATPTVAWTELVRWRGLVRHELGLRHLDTRGAPDTALDALRARWVRAQDAVAAAAVRGAGAADETALRQADDLRRAYVSAASGRLSILPDDSLSIELVVGALEPHQALIAYYETAAGTDSARIGVLVWRAGEPAPHQQPLGTSAGIGARIGAWDASLEAPGTRGGAPGPAGERAARRAGEHVRAGVWDPIARVVGDAREVFVVPAGPLQDLHWEALPLGPGGYWAERGPVVRVLNAERELLDPPLVPASGGVLAFGGIDYSGTATPGTAGEPIAARFRRARRDCRDGLPPSFGPLAATAREIQAVATAWPAGAGAARLVSGGEATEATFKQLAHGYRAIHLATHGYAPRDTCASAETGSRGIGRVGALAAPGASSRPAARPAGAAAQASDSAVVWLAFAGANRAAQHESADDDGLLTPEEVVALDLRGTGWVVLSSCYATSGREDWANEGLSGMRRAFHMAGARTVVGSCWPVSDEATADWMRALYAARAAGADSPGAAIHRACAAVLAARRHGGRSTHPFYWASFTSTGE